MVTPSTYSIAKIKRKLAPLFGELRLQMVILFGSLVSEKVHSESDIDVGVVFDEPVDLLNLTNRIINLLQTDKVDVVDLRRASPLLRFAAVRNGKLIYERTPGQFNTFFSLSFRRYVDTKKLRIAQQRAIDHFLNAKGLT
jgi:uncharacterized protein